MSVRRNSETGAAAFKRGNRQIKGARTADVFDLREAPYSRSIRFLAVIDDGAIADEHDPEGIEDVVCKACRYGLSVSASFSVTRDKQLQVERLALRCC